MTIFFPINAPTVFVSDHGTPMTAASGMNMYEHIN
jgi:hypothetical protein